MKVYEYCSDTYPITIHILILDDKDIKDEKYVSYLNKNYETEDNFKFTALPNGTAARTYGDLSTKDSCYVVLTVYKKDYLTMPKIMHESLHMLDWIVCYLGMDSGFQIDRSNEHLAYLIEWIGRCHEDVLQRQKSKKK